MTIRFSLLTIESDSADPTIMAAMRELLERAGAGVVVVPAGLTAPPQAAPDAAPSQKHTSIARHLMDGSLQELIMEAVAGRPGVSVHDLAATVLNETTGSAKTRIGMAVGPLVLTGRLVRGNDGKLYTPAAAATLPAFQGPPNRGGPSKGSKSIPHDPGPVTAVAAPERAPCSAFPPCRNCREGAGACLSMLKPATPIEREARASTRLDGETRVVEPKPQAPLRVHVPLDEKPPQASPTGRVVGFVAKATDQADLVDRVIKTVQAQPGTSVQALAMVLLGSASSLNVRRIDMLVGPLVMSGRLARTNGRLFGTASEAAAAPAPMLPRRAPGQAAPLSDVQRKKDAYNRIVAAFSQDTAYSIPKLATELFGDSSGNSTRKVNLMLRQLAATERLERVGANEWRPIGDKEQRGRGLDDESQADDEQELESNGHPDDEEPQELDVG